MDIATIFLFNNIQKMKYLAKTGILVDIHKMGKNTRCLAIPEPAATSEICPGVFLNQHSENFSDHNFTNVYDLSWNPADRSLVPEITSSNTPFFLNDQMQEDKLKVAAINGAFFFLSDIADREPVDLPYNFCIRNFGLIGLPSSDSPVLYIKDGILKAEKLKAVGTISIGQTVLNWEGAQRDQRSAVKKIAVLYNSRCSDVVKSRDPLTNIQIGILDSKNITTPKSRFVTDVVVGMDRNQKLVVTQINPQGGTHFFAGNFILQLHMTSCTFSVGDRVNPLTLDSLVLSEIQDGMTIGKAVDDGFFAQSVRINRQDARSVIAEDQIGMMHLIVFDGSKYVPGFNGVSAQDIRPFFSKKRFKWAYFLDGGGSSRVVVRQNNKLLSFANQFSFQKRSNGWIKWDWKRSRKITSSISLRLLSTD